MSKMYNVPALSQISSDTCWHYSSLMIWEYWQRVSGRQGPMNTLAGKWSSNSPVMVSDFVTLAAKTGLTKVIERKTTYTAKDIENMLTRFGPLWCAGFWFGLGHIIVLTGIKGNDIYFNDPDGGFPKKETVAWFNSKLSSEIDGCLMYKNPHAY